MPCRVGITTDVDRRKREWKQRVIGLRGWREYGSYPDKESAQRKENELVANCDRNRGTCHEQPGGGDPNAEGWTVYSFDYDRVRRDKLKMASSRGSPMPKAG